MSLLNKKTFMLIALYAFFPGYIWADTCLKEYQNGAFFEVLYLPSEHKRIQCTYEDKGQMRSYIAKDNYNFYPPSFPPWTGRNFDGSKMYSCPDTNSRSNNKIPLEKLCAF